MLYFAFVFKPISKKLFLTHYWQKNFKGVLTFGYREMISHHKLHPFKVYNSLFLVYSKSCNPSTINTSSGIFSSPQKETPYPLVVTAHSFPRCPWQPLIYFPSLWIYQFWKFQIKWFLRYVAFCNWLLPLSIMFSSFTQVIAWVRISFIFMAE